MEALVYNDLHFGVKRTAGTTAATQVELRGYLLNSFLDHALANLNGEDYLIINGDLFDGFEVDTGTIRDTYDVLSTITKNRITTDLILVMGNHDASAKGDRVSSFHLMSHFLLSQWGERVTIVDNRSGLYNKPGTNLWFISHQMNQDLFNLQIDRAIAEGGNDRFLFLHCNIKNTFAENADHSLNLSDEQLGKLMVAGWTLIVGHEHQGYELRGGRVQVIGNQFPSSIADCLGNTSKSALHISDTEVSRVTTWHSSDSFIEIEWDNLDEVPDHVEFIRVIGEASADQSDQVVRAISSLRQSHNAYVITNAVKIEGQTMTDVEIADVDEALRATKVLDLIMEQLNDSQQAVVKELLGD